MSVAVLRDSLRPSPSGTLIMRPANGPARRLAVSVGGVCVVGVDAGSCVEVEEKERKKERVCVRERKTKGRCELRRRGRPSETEKIERDFARRGGEEEEEGQSGSGNDRPSALEANIDECPALLLPSGTGRT